jgi:hypothetical protein
MVPVAGAPGESIDLTPFVGEWLTEPETSTVLELAADGENTLHGLARVDTSDMSSDMSPPPVTFTVAVSYIDGRTVASVRSLQTETGPQQPQWTVAAVEVDETGQRLTVHGLNPQVIQQAIASGELAGQPLAAGVMEDGPQAIAADGAALRSFLSSRPDAFEEAAATVLVRRGSQAGGADQVFAPHVNRALPRSDSLQVAQGYPYPGPAEAPWMTPSDLDSGPSGYPFQTPAPFEVGASSGAASDQPEPLANLVLAMVSVLVVGMVATTAYHTIKRRAANRAAVAPVAVADAAFDGPMVEEAADGTSLLATLRRYALPMLLILAVAVGPVVFLTALLQGLAFPDSAPGMLLGTQAMLYGFAPYLLVFSFGALIGMAEVIATFPAFASEALGTRWALLLVLLNALAITMVFSVSLSATSGGEHPLIRAGLVAAAFAVLMRTRLVLARDLRGGAGGVGLDFGWLYARFQSLCYQRIERDLLRDPHYAVERLLQLFPDSAALERVATNAILAEDPSRTATLQARLDAIGADDLGPSLRRARLARFIVQTGGLDHARFLIEYADPPAGAGPPGPQSSASPD